MERKRVSGGFLWRFENEPIEKPLFKGAKQIKDSIYLQLLDDRVYSTKSKQFMRLQTEMVTCRKYINISLDGVRTKWYIT